MRSFQGKSRLVGLDLRLMLKFPKTSFWAQNHQFKVLFKMAQVVQN